MNEEIIQKAGKETDAVEEPPKAPAVNIKPCSEYIADLNALEQAILDICGIITVCEIHMRKEILVKK